MRTLGLWNVIPVAVAAAVGTVACGSSHGSSGTSGSHASGLGGSGSNGGSASNGGSGSNGGSASNGGAGSNGGSASNGAYGSGSGASAGSGGGANPVTGAAGGTLVTPYAGAGNGGQSQIITTGISPKSCGPTSAFNGTSVTVVSGDDVTCFYSASVSYTIPLAFVEQDEEIIGGKDLIHVRLTLDPAFVDNTYGTNAIGWGGGTDAGTGMKGMGMGMHGHTFFDLVDSDHAEFDFLDSSGNTVLAFDEDYVSADSNAPSGYGCLGVSGGDGAMITGSASSIIYYGTSFDRDLNACGYGQYTTNSPATDSSYTPSAAAPNWDYRVVYDVWVLKSVLPSGWTVSIPYVHASPSKLQSTYTVTAAPCPPLHCVGEGCNPGGTCVGPWCDAGGCVGEGCNNNGPCVGAGCDSGSGSSGQCVGEGCNNNGTCVGAGCTGSSGSSSGCVGEGCNNNGTCVGSNCTGSSGSSSGSSSGCVGEGCNSNGTCYGLLCDSGSPTECIGEACNDGGGATGGSWCLVTGAECTDNSACCSGGCSQGICVGETPR